MKQIIYIGIAGLFVLFLYGSGGFAQDSRQGTSKAPPREGAEVDMKGYTIGPEDVLSIDVWKEPTLAKTVPVRMDGKISLPLIDEIQAAGLTPLQLKEVLTQRFKRYVDDPVVSVVVTQIESHKVYVSGQVKNPGVYKLRSETSLVQIIPMSGGFTEWADQKRITIIRKEDGKERRFIVNYKKIIKGDGLDSNVVLKPGDTIIVP